VDVSTPIALRVLEAGAQSRPLGHSDPDVDTFERIDYLETELLISGVAAGDPYTTRVLLRYPRTPEAFSGIVMIEPMHWVGHRTVWRATRRHLLRGGHAYAEIASQQSAEARLKEFDPARYREVELVDGSGGVGPPEASIGLDAAAGRDAESVRRESDAFRDRWAASSPQHPEIVAQFVAALRSGSTPIGAVRQVLMGGLSQSGGVVRSFISDHHVRLSDGAPVIDGYLAMSSGGDALPDIDVPVIELLGEAEMEELRMAHLLPGQVRGFSHRRPDSANFRLYEVAGMSHLDTRSSAVDLGDALLPEGTRWSRFPGGHVVHAVLEALIRQVVDGVEPPVGRVLDLDADGRIARDTHGHALGGFRTAYLEVPTANVTVIAGPGQEWSRGCERPFDQPSLESLYGTEAAYRARVAASLEELVAAGHYLPRDAAEYLDGVEW
jgi:hypothetical protein